MIIDIKKISLFKFVLYTVISCGTYPLLWLVANLSALNSVVINTKKIELFHVVVLASLWSWASYLIGFRNSDTPSEVDLYISLTNFALNISFMIYAYMVVVKPFIIGLDEKLLKEYKIDLRPNMIWAFIFSYWYIIYALNKVDDIAKRAEVINSHGE